MARFKQVYEDNSGKEHLTLDEATAHDLLLAGAVNNIVYARAIVANRDTVMGILKLHKELETA